MPKWGRDAMKQAVNKVKRNELSLNKASKLYGIPVATLHGHVHATSSPRPAGRPTILTYSEEKEIVYACQVFVIYHTYRVS